MRKTYDCKSNTKVLRNTERARKFYSKNTNERYCLLFKPCTYKLYQNVLQTLLRVRVALLLKATSESGESGFLTVCALVPGAQSSGPSSSPAGGPYCVQSDSLHPGV